MKKILLLSAIVASVTLSADPLITYIGAKAKSMGGAFTAIANNNSAMYFNPAGLVNFEGLEHTMITLEVGTGARRDQSAQTIDDKFDSSKSYFFGYSTIGKNTGTGLAMYSLYNLNLENGSNSGEYLSEEVTVTSLSYAYKLGDKLYPYGGKLSIGVTGAYASSFSDSDPEILSVNGWFYAVGVKMRLLQHRTVKIDVGVNYRSGTDLKSEGGIVKGIGVPQELAYGVSISYGTESGLFTLSGDLKDTGYLDATTDTFFTLSIDDVTTTNLGFEFATASYQLRAGAYKSAYKDNDTNEITGITAGAGVVFGGSLSLEAAYDARTYVFGSDETTQAFYTVSVNQAF